MPKHPTVSGQRAWSPMVVDAVVKGGAEDSGCTPRADHDLVEIWLR